jgi:putative flippase GtrA
MSDLVPGGGRPPSRRERERRAYQLAVVGGTAAVIAVVGFVLALLTSFPGSVAVLAAIVAVVCAVMFRRAVS